MLSNLKLGQVKTINCPYSQKNCDAEVELINELMQKIEDRLPLTITGSQSPAKYEPGQVWTNDRDKIIIDKEWDRFFIVKDKYGSKKKIPKSELPEIIRNGKYKLLNNKQFKLLLITLSKLLIPYVGAQLGKLLVGLIERLIKKSSLK